MKNLRWLWIVGIGGMIVVAIIMAGQMGQKNPAMVRGTVVLSPDLEQAAKGIQTLFLIVGSTEMPMPYGALRHTLSEDPKGTIYEFALTMDNLQRMRPQEPWPESFKVKARLDRDGNAGPDQPGDLVGEVAPLHPGAEGVEIRIDKVIP